MSAMHKHYWLITVLDEIHEYSTKNRILNFTHLIEAAQNAIAREIIPNLLTPTQNNSVESKFIADSVKNMRSLERDTDTIKQWDEDLGSDSITYH